YLETLASKSVERLVLMPVGGINAACNLCKEFLDRFYNSLKRDSDFAVDTIKKELVSSCEDVEGKGQTHYIATSYAPTKVGAEVSCPVGAHVPMPSICEKLKTTNTQFIELKCERKLDLKSMELSKMREAELWKLLSSWGKASRACMEKTELGSLIKALVPKYACRNLRSDH
uniref:Cerebral dopamine neurotrophic factor n=1 Tax=Dromaius novaehollandiae TaxID=8790 RepID=A0A8C4K2P2_DRONO